MKFKIINLSQEVEAPIFRENRNNQWIDYGSDNNYPNYLIDIFHSGSNKHKAIINRKVDMTTGNGIQLPQTEELKAFLENKWSEDTVEEISKMINYDLEIFSGFAILVKWSIDGSRISSIEHIPFNKCRLSVDGESIFLSKDWSNHRRSANKPIEIPIFNPLKKDLEKKQIYYYVEKSIGIDYYAIPYYSSTINWIELDWEISNFHLKSIKNGFMPGFILNFASGIPTDEEMDIAYKEFERKYTGSNNAGKFILTFSEGKEGAPELTPISLNDSDDRFVLLHQEMKEEILIGHSVTSPLLFGIRTEGALGGRTEMLEALAIFQSTYVNGKQKTIQDQLNKITKYSGVTEPIIFNKYVLDFSNIENTEK